MPHLFFLYIFLEEAIWTLEISLRMGHYDLKTRGKKERDRSEKRRGARKIKIIKVKYFV